MKKFGIALAGGGARGAYQIGAWKALKEHGLDQYICAYAGASVGSLNATLFAMGDYELAEKLWMSLERDTLFNFDKKILKRIFKEKLNFLNRGVYSTKKLVKMMNDVIDFDKVRDTKIFIATTHLGNEDSSFFDLLQTNYKHYFKKSNQIVYKSFDDASDKEIVDTLLASCAIPVAFQPITIGGETFYDGGILDNRPIQPLVDAGCEVILTIDLFKYAFTRKKEIKGSKIITIYPKKSLRGILDFSSSKIRRRFELGYEDTIAMIDEIKELLEEK